LILNFAPLREKKKRKAVRHEDVRVLANINKGVDRLRKVGNGEHVYVYVGQITHENYWRATPKQ